MVSKNGTRALGDLGVDGSGRGAIQPVPLSLRDQEVGVDARQTGTSAVAGPIGIVDSFQHVPVSLFGSVLGVAGLAIAWRLAHDLFGVPIAIASVLDAVAIACFILVGFGYGLKLLLAPAAVLSEFNHPIKGSLFGTLPISLLLLPINIAPTSLPLAQAIWWVGAATMFAFACFVINRWISRPQQLGDATPTWIVPVVGVLDVPLAMPTLGWPPMHGLMILGLAIGLFFTIPLFTLIFARLLFQPQMPVSIQPTVVILVAPFAVGTSAYLATTGDADIFAQSLYAMTLFLLLILASRVRHLGRCCPFQVSWWAISFPLAASSVAAIRMAAAYPGPLSEAFAFLLLLAVTLVIAALSWLTLTALARGELRTIST